MAEESQTGNPPRTGERSPLSDTTFWEISQAISVTLILRDVHRGTRRTFWIGPGVSSMSDPPSLGPLPQCNDADEDVTRRGGRGRCEPFGS
jgi:hypothetical protein